MVGVSVVVGVGVIVGVDDGVGVFVDVGVAVDVGVDVKVDVGVLDGVGVKVGVMLGVGVEVARIENMELHPERMIPVKMEHPIRNINPVHRTHFLSPIPTPPMLIKTLQPFLYQNSITLSNVRTLVKHWLL